MSTDRQQFFVVLQTPDGARHDITDRTDLRSLGTLTEELEDDLAQLTHPDIDLTLFDDDGWVSAIFANVRRGDQYRIELDRRSGEDYERVFTGLVEIPNGIRNARTDREVTLSTFALSKHLEMADASDYKRTVEGLTGTVSASSRTVTIGGGTTDDLAVGDKITLDDGSNTETQKIHTIDSSTQVTTVVAFTNGFTSAALTLETPYYRGKTIAALAADLFKRAGINDYRIEPAGELTDVPFPSSINTSGLGAGQPAGMLERSADLSVYVGGNRYDAADPSAGFTSGGADTVKADWRPYKTSEPGTLRPAGSADDGSRAVDYDTGDYYTLVVTGTPAALQLHKNGAFLVTVEAGVSSPPWGATIYPFKHVEFNEMEDEIWVGYWQYAHDDSGLGSDVNRGRVKVYNSSGTLLRTVSTVFGASLRCVAPLGRMALHPLTWSTPSNVASAGGIRLYNGSSYDLECDDVGVVGLWTLRALGDYLVVLQSTGSEQRAVLLDKTTGDLVVTHALVSSGAGLWRATVYDEGGAATGQYCCYVGGRYFTISAIFSGIIPYAEFEDMSCGAALRELALVAGAYLWVDEFGRGWLAGRRATLLARTPIELSADPLESIEMPVSEWYREGCTVTGEDEDDNEVEVTVGDESDSANRLEISVELPLTTGLASALASAYYAYLGGLGRQLDEKIIEPDSGRLRPLDLVVRDGQHYRVLRVESSLDDREQTVQLVKEG